jgi:hypothetical protein
MDVVVGGRELLVVVSLATAGLVVAAEVALSPWYAGPAEARTPVVRIVAPGGVADRP